MEAESSPTPTTLRIVIPGEPVGKERPRFPKITPAMIGQMPRPYTASKTREYENRIKLLAQVAVRQQRWGWSDDDRFHVLLKIFRTHVDAGPDVDNVAKAALDAINSIAYPDDRRVWGIGVALQPRDKKNPRIEVVVRRIQKSALLGKADK